jgi:putative heme-binding domain-containing protein
MRDKLSPWGPIALVLAAAGVVLASVPGTRWPCQAPAALGVLVALLGIPATRKGTVRDWVWLALGGALSATVLCLTLFAPGLLNPRWEIDTPVPQPDPNRLVRVPIDRPLDEGRPVGDEDWVDAATEGIRQDDLFVAVRAAKAADLTGRSAAARLHVSLSLHQRRPGQTIIFGGFGRDQHTPVLTDGAGRGYAFVGHNPERFSAVFDLVPLHLDHVLVFELPPAGTQSLKLTVPSSAWGRQGVCRFHIARIEREAPPDATTEVARYKKLVRTPPLTPPDVALGRAQFCKHCLECHTLFGVGGKKGPDLTASKRNDLDFLVTSIVNPSAEIAKGFEPSVVYTTSGRIITGIIKESNDRAVTVQGAGPKDLEVVPRKDIEDIQPSKISIMPTELLKLFDEHEVRSLIAYLSGTRQVPLLARPDTVVLFSSYGQDLTFWQRARGTWGVDGGEIVGAGPPAGEPPLLVSEVLLAGDFQATMRFRVGKDGRGAVLLRGEDPDSPPGPRVEFAAGAPLVLAGGGESVRVGRVEADSWTKLEIKALGRGLEVRLNGKESAALADTRLRGRRAIALEGPGAAGQEVRFVPLNLQLPAAEKRE